MSRWMAVVVACLLVVGMMVVGYAVLYATWFYTDDVFGHIGLDFRDVAELRGGGRFWVDLVMLLVGVGLWELRAGALAVSLATGRPMPLQWTSLEGAFGHTIVLAAVGLFEALSSPRVVTLFGDIITFHVDAGVLWLLGGLGLVMYLVVHVHVRARAMVAAQPVEAAAAPPAARPMIKAPLSGAVSVDGDPFRGSPRAVIAVQPAVAPKLSPRAETADPAVEPPKLLR